MKSVLSRWFPTAEEEREAERQMRQAEAATRERVGEFLRTAFMADFKSWLGNARRQVEPRPGDPENMLYNMGVRDGVQLVIDHLDSLSDVLKRSE